ncbi:MAG: hypothetical protein ASARMPREDX12_002468 [Alectoria sarmentosa]|nr:MAG: hypothetical protein ASARMPREDX12_002468 [Alectoria sarmentosa]
MSNQLVGTVYQRIMDDVIENCQTTFEEDGVNQQTLDDLRKTWQTKLSALHVGSFPWEPPPAPQPMANPTVPSNIPRPQQVPSSGVPTPSAPAQSNGASGVRIKNEPGYEQQGFQTNGLPPNYGNTVAQQRAAANLQQKFGAGANVQISQLQAQAAMGTPGGQPQRSPMNIQLPPQMTDQQRQEQVEFKRRQQAQQYQNLQHAQQRPMVNNAQTDGADEWDGYIAQRRLDASKDPGKTHEADLTIRQQVEQMNRSMEGGGLMMPLADQSKLPQMKKRKTVNPEAGPRGSYSDLAAAQSSDYEPVPRISQMDGDDEDEDDDKTGIKDELFDDDDDDEDAINSDLDDPDDNVIEEEPEDGRPQQIMLCTYDKVARVKNKWKCTLKDGVLTTGGKEYVFHRAQVKTDKAPPPLPVYSQAIVCNGMVYCSGQVAMHPESKTMIQGGISDRTAQCFKNLSAVLEEAGSSMKNVVRVGVFLTDMTNFAAMNKCRTCVAVKELPMRTDVEIELIAHL